MSVTVLKDKASAHLVGIEPNRAPKLKVVLGIHTVYEVFTYLEYLADTDSELVALSRLRSLGVSPVC